MPSWRLVLVSIIFVVFKVGYADAETACPAASSAAHARQLAAQQFERAEQLFNQRDCRAIARFQCSYRLFPHPNTLFNIGRTAEQCSSFELALSSYRQFIDLYPDAPGRSEVDSRLVSLEHRMATREHRVDQVEVAQDQPPPPSSPAEPTPVAEPSSRASTNRLMSIVGWSTLATGGTMTIIGAALLGASGSVHDDFVTRQNDGASESELRTLADRGHALQVSGGVLLGLGLAVLTAGVVLTVLEWWRRRRAPVSWRPAQLLGANVVRRM